MNSLPLFSSVHAGAPHPLDETGEIFDLAGHLIKNPAHTSYVRVAGDSMEDLGIFDGDILIVDHAIEPKPSDIVLAEVDGNYTVKQFRREFGNLRLVPANPAYCSIDLTPEMKVCGVARFTIHRL